MPDARCPGCRHTVPAGRWCNRCGTPLADVAVAVGSGGATSSWRARALATGGVAATIGVVLWGGTPAWQSEVVTSQEVGGAVLLADGAPPPSSPTPPSVAPTVPPREPPEERTNVVCSDLRPRSVPTADLDTDEPGELVQVWGRTCVVMREEGVTVP